MPFHSSLENLSREQQEKREQRQDPHMERPWSTFQSTLQLPPIACSDTLFPQAAGHFQLLDEGAAKNLPPRKRISQDGAVSVTKKQRLTDQPAMGSQGERSHLSKLMHNDASAMTVVEPYKKPPPFQHWISMPAPPSAGPLPAGTFGVLKDDGQTQANGQSSTLFIEEKPPFMAATHRMSWMEEEMPLVKRNKRGRPPSSSKHDAQMRKTDIPMPRPILNSPPALPSAPSTVSTSASETTTSKKQSADSASSRQSTPIKSRKRRTTYKKEPKEQLYCICRQPYVQSRFMIACDRCDQWFHGSCVGISEKQGEFIDYYYCPECAKVENKSTVWKPACANPNCQKAARISHHGYESRFCSNNCGMQVARARVELAEIKRREANPNGMSYADVINMQRAKRNQSRSLADKDDMKELEKVRNCKERTKAQVATIEKKLEFLGYLLYQLDEQRAAAEEDICGFDSRLVWDDYTWERVQKIVETDDGNALDVIFVDNHGLTDEERNFSVCSEPRKKCHRHADWERIKLAEIEHDRAFLFGTLERLQEERKQIKARFKRRKEENDKLDWLANATTTTS